MHRSLVFIGICWLAWSPAAMGQVDTTGPRSAQRVRLEAGATVDSLLGKRDFGRYAVIAAEWKVMNDPSYQGVDGTKLVLGGWVRIPRFKVDMDDHQHAIQWSNRTLGQDLPLRRDQTWEKGFEAIGVVNKFVKTRYGPAIELFSIAGKLGAKPLSELAASEAEHDALRRLPTISGNPQSNFLEHVGIKREEMVAMMQDVLERRYSGVVGAERADRFVRKVLGTDYSHLSDESLAGMRDNLPTPEELQAESRQFVENYQRATEQKLSDLMREVKELRRAADEVARQQAKESANAEENRRLQEREDRLRDEIQGLNFANECFGSLTAHLRGDAAKVANAVRVIVNVSTRIMSAYLVKGVAMAAIAPPLAIAAGVFDLLGLFGGGGPDASQLILEQLAELRRELAEFRAETRLSLIMMRQDVLDVGDQVLTRIGAAEANLSRQLGRVEGQVSDVEARINLLENRLMANQAQVLGRLAELLKISLDTNIDLMKTRKKTIRDGLAKNPGDLGLIQESQTLLSVFVTFANTGASYKVNSGGDARFTGIYDANGVPILREGYGDQLRWISDNQNNGWASINDFATLARSVGVGEVAGSPHVNPLVWQVAVNPFLELALASRELGGVVRDNNHLRKSFVEMYLAGERLRRTLFLMTRKEASGSVGLPETRLFQKLIDMQLAAINNFERYLLLEGEKLAAELRTNPFAEDLMEPREDVFRPAEADLDVERLTQNKAPFELPEARVIVFSDPAEVERKAIPKALRMAKQLGLVEIQVAIDEIGYTEVRKDEYEKEVPWPDEATRRYARIVGVITANQRAGGLAQNSSFNDPIVAYRIRVPQWRGKVFAILTVRVKPLEKSTQFATIIRRRLVCPEEVTINEVDRFSNEKTENSGNPAHSDLSVDWQAQGRAIVRYNEREGDFLFFGGGRDVPHAVLASEVPGLRKAQIEKHWPRLVADWLASPAQEPDQTLAEQNKRGAEVLQWVERRCTEHIVSKVLPFMNRQLLATEEGLGRLGNAVRELHGTQATLHQYAVLAMPQQLDRDSRLMDAIAGETAALSRSVFAKHLKSPEVSVNPLRISGLVEPGPGGAPIVPLVQTMRQNTERLRGILAEAIARQAEAGPPSHAEIEATLTRLALAAKAMEIDLEAECRKLGAEPNNEWILRNLNRPHQRLAALLGENL